MTKYIVDIGVAALFFFSSIYLWFVADAFPVFEKYKNIDSDMWPKLILVVIGLLAAAVLFQSVRSLLEYRKKIKPLAKQTKKDNETNFSWKKTIIISVLCIAYFYGLFYLGFIVSTMLFLYITINWIGIPSKKLRILYPLLFTSGLALVFVKLLELSLPRGVGIFRSFSLLIY